LPIALLATTLVTHAVFFGEDRYHVVVTPVLALLAAAALRAWTPERPAGRADDLPDGRASAAPAPVARVGTPR